mgnify:CR=1 FL=1
MSAAHLVGLNIASPLVTAESVNFLPSQWPPSAEFPIVVDEDGRVISRYADAIWNFTVWAGKPLSINFEDGGRHKDRITPKNGELFRRIVCWWLYSPNGVQRTHTLSARFHALKFIFVLCSEQRISASDLIKFPAVAESISARVAPSNAGLVVKLLHDLWEARSVLGFALLDAEGIKRLNATSPNHEVAQTPYIPPRIWSYQISRLMRCLDDFNAHAQKVEECYRFCLSAYAHNAGGLPNAFNGLKAGRQPFNPVRIKRGTRMAGCKYYESFRHVAERFEIDTLLDRWVNSSTKAGIQALSSYLSLVSWVGVAYSLNFSLMRIDEACQLRVGCYSVERDDLGEDIHTLGGITTKTIFDGDARWIVSPTVSAAITALTTIARLRIEVAVQNPFLKLRSVDVERPRLLGRAEEPWVRKGHHANVVRQSSHGFRDIAVRWPKLFNDDDMRITAEDLRVARLITPTLDPERFAQGKVWPLAWHQLRRTGAVNMLSTGLVRDSALQFQLKHVSRAMSRYYGQNFYHLKASRLDEGARAIYIRGMYEAIAREFSLLGEARFVSPYGEKRKSQILEAVTEGDHKSLLTVGKTGKIAYRETFLGGCCNPGPPCPLGGITNIAGCMGRRGEHPCEWTLLDQAKRPRINRLREIIQERLDVAESDSFQQKSLQAQLESAEKALEVLDDV